MKTGERICPYYDAGKCKSCGLIKEPYESQLKLKERKIREIYLGTDLEEVSVFPVIPVGEPLGSRSKAKMVVSGFAHAPVIGLSDGSEHNEILACPLHHSAINEVLSQMPALIMKSGLAPYNIQKKKGELKYLIIRHAATTGQTMVRLVLRSTESIERAKRLASYLQKAVPHVCVVSVNIQPLHAAILEGPKEEVLTTAARISDIYDEIEVIYSPQSFSQVTHETAARLYSWVSRVVANKHSRSALDLYCGSGAFSLFCARFVAQVTGVEITSTAIDCAREAAVKNGFSNIEFFSGDVEEFLRKSPPGRWDSVIVNPPRRGLSEEITAELKRLSPDLILYSSCNPETQKRDLLELSKDYAVECLQPFDMFPLTEHVEVVAILTKKTRG